MVNPLILTLALNPEAQSVFNGLRRQYFPAERNYLDAHLTLFHNLPANEPQIVQDILSLCSQHNILTLQATEIKNIGRGVAYRVESYELLKLHLQLQRHWQHWLIPQDKQKLFPHITIQNKVDSDTASRLQQELAKDFISMEFYGIGLSLWEYLGGPWRFIEIYKFKPRSL